MTRGCSSVGCAADSSTPVSARSVTFAQPLGAWNEKPWALSIGPEAGFTAGELGELVGEVASVAPGSATVLLDEPHAESPDARTTAAASHGARARRRRDSMREGYAPE